MQQDLRVVPDEIRALRLKDDHGELIAVGAYIRNISGEFGAKLEQPAVAPVFDALGADGDPANRNYPPAEDYEPAADIA